MRTFHWPVRAFLFVGLLQTVSCTKTADTLSTQSVSIETSSDATLAGEFPTCKMRRIYQDYAGAEGAGRVTGVFTYNGAGNPISLIYNNNGTGNRNHYFTYDNQGRLKGYRLTYNDGQTTDVRHGYAYDAANRIIRDTTVAGDPSSPVVFLSTITYDAQGRIIKENIKNIVNPDPAFPIATRNPTYTYDARGNLAVAGWKSSSYDNRVSAFRSHPVFQFLSRNYSKNNAAVQAKYNSKGLPLSLNPGNDDFFNGKTTYLIVYDCQ